LTLLGALLTLSLVGLWRGPSIQEKWTLLSFPARLIVALPMYVLGPLALLLRMRIDPARAALPVTAADETALPTELRQGIEAAESKLKSQGFGPPVHTVSKAVSNMTTYASLLENPDGKALATVGVARHNRGLTITAIFFRSDLADGTRIVTSNANLKRRFPNRPGYDAIAFPKIQDSAELYRLHRFRTQERSLATPRRSITRAPDPMRFHAAEMGDTYAYWIKIGYNRREADGTLRLTPKGAVATAWRGMFPWLQIVRRSDREAREAVLARYGRGTTGATPGA
jgi:hypothetical protein